MKHAHRSIRLGWVALAIAGWSLVAKAEPPAADASPVVVIPPGTSLFCPSVLGDDRLDGDLGAQLAGVVDSIRLREPGSTNLMVLQLNGARQWVDQAGATYARALTAGQGLVVTRAGTTPARLDAKPGRAEATIIVQEGLNIIGFPRLKPVPLAEAFEHPTRGEPVGSYDETKADEIDLLNPDGSWRRLIRLPTRVWYDTLTQTNTVLELPPGQALYYQRQPGAGPLQFQLLLKEQ